MTNAVNSANDWTPLALTTGFSTADSATWTPSCSTGAVLIGPDGHPIRSIVSAG